MGFTGAGWCSTFGLRGVVEGRGGDGVDLADVGVRGWALREDVWEGVQWRRGDGSGRGGAHAGGSESGAELSYCETVSTRIEKGTCR